MHGCGGGARTDSASVATDPLSSAPAAAPTPSSAVPPAAVRTGSVPLDQDRPTTESGAEEYAFWLDQLKDTAIDGEAVSDTVDDIKGLADSYGGAGDETQLVQTIPGKGSRARDGLRTAAKELKSGEKSLQKGDYSKAQNAFDRASRALDDMRGSVRKDLVAIERVNALRLTQDGAVSGDASSDFATVVSWVDGDTVDTDRGRVRVLGINAPEMHEQCQPAQAAKDAASQLAPAGQRVELVNPESVRDTDKYGRLLRYVDVVGGGASASSGTVDVGYSLLLSSLAEPRYDSQDGYQWHPREAAYRATGAKPAAGVACPVAADKTAFVLASTLAATKGEDEYWRHKLIDEVIGHSYRSASKTLKKYVKAVRKDDEKAERGEKAAKERARRARSEELARERESSGSSSSSDDSSDSSSGGGDDYPGYTGPRCYAPGGGSWKPC